MKTKATYNSRTTTADEECLYNHLLACVAVESPEAMIDRFQALFVDGFGYPDRDVAAALDRLLGCHEIDESFRFVLNRCCHILINRWQTNTQLQPAIPVLIDLLETAPASQTSGRSRSRSVRRLRQVTQSFLESEQHLALKRLARIIEARQSALPRNRSAAAVPLGSLINRYPYLYEHCLVTEDSDLQHQQCVRNMQVEAQHKFEVDLSHYVTYRVRQGRMHRQGKTDFADKLRVVPNPTLLTDQDLVSSLKQFARRRDHGQSYRDGAQRFLLTHSHGASFRQFKEDLFDYILADVDSSYSQRQFKSILQDHLLATANDSDGKPVDDFLRVRTCSNLFNLLVVDPSAGRQHYLFLDLINNLGPLQTTGLLLRILLICHKVKPFLERRFSLLFNHYETSSSETVAWLVNMFENINIALSLNFGSVDLSHAGAR
ncbi:MAG: hypothetical protein EA368_19500 [Leptolyngbya sp. DLM2.Bin27]|nr:MAG: hypothetical protein EA368_19500 [Leptolyngbya sp. DLM2.Bin27]